MTRLIPALSLLWCSLALAAPSAAVIVNDNGGLAPEEVHAVRNLAIEELTVNHVEVTGDPRFEGMHAPDQQLLDALKADGLTRLFVVVVNGRLGQKIPFTLEERDPSGAVVASASLSSTGIEEADSVIPRLVRAVLTRTTAEQAATMESVTTQEATPFKKKQGEFYWSLGLDIPTYAGTGTASIFGASIGYHYELPFWRVGVIGEFAGNKGLNSEFCGLEAAFLPIDGEISPYLGGGFGFGATQSGSGVAFKAEAGVELMRLHNMRLLAGMDLFIPAFNDHERVLYPLVHVRFMY